MLELGRKQRLNVVKLVEFGVYLAKKGEEEEKVLLPAKQVPEGTKQGDELEVFLYKDSKDRLISTIKKPMLEVGELGLLRVIETGKIGAFLDWGLEKDLLLPFKEQTKRVKGGDECLVALYIDKSSRLCATMRVYSYLEKRSPYKKDDIVHARVYEHSEEFGLFAAVDDRYSALIPKKEDFGHIFVGDRIEARVTEVKEDGKLDLSVRKKAYLQIDEDAKHVLNVIDKYKGSLPFTDKASPEVIKRELNMSKNGFKRAIGRLLKEGKVELKENNIQKK
ncbi:RNA-binding protein [bacterium 1XD42-8]|jgi:predicted RNA-binding protein (virulence factor B family)|nr:RNA-binding protein [Lachnospiraceae bacterium]RKJ52978.1 RNA-binding protein [bacterium 1XD42-8]